MTNLKDMEKEIKTKFKPLYLAVTDLETRNLKETT